MTGSVAGALRRLALSVVLAVAALTAVVCGSGPAQAHGPASTLLTVAMGPDSTAEAPVLVLDARIPLDRLDFAYGTDFAVAAERDGTSAAVQASRSAIEELLRDRVRLTTPTGASWQVRLATLEPIDVEDAAGVRAVLSATPPQGSPDLQGVDLRWDLITDTVVTHRVFVGGVGADGVTRMVGTIDQQSPQLRLDVMLPGPEAVSSTDVPAMAEVGFQHFREGPDHLLFLCLLALAAVRRRSATGVVLKRLAVLTLTFTVGHSLSLALAAAGVIDLPSRWVEAGIAATIVLAAVHAVRPTLPARVEVGTTSLFGLIHGFGFAGVLSELSLSGRELVGPLFGFNVGLEAAQLLGLALILLPTWVLARSSAAALAVAAAIGAVATSWLIQRALGTTNPLDPVLEVVLATPERLALELALVALVAEAARRVVRQRRGRAESPFSSGRSAAIQTVR